MAIGLLTGLKTLRTVTAEEKKAMTDEQLIALTEENTAIQTENFRIFKEYAEAEEKEKLKLKEAIQKQGEKITALKATPSSHLAEFKRENHEKLVSAIKAKAGKQKHEFKLDSKALVNDASISNSTYSQRISEIGKQPVRVVVMESLFNAGEVGADSGNKITYVDQDSLNRNADTVANCSAIPESEITWIERDLDIKKIADSIPVCKDTLENYSFIQTEIDTFLMENMRLKTDEQLLLGDGTGNNLTGVDTIAQLWSVAAGSPIESLAGSVISANIHDVLEAGICQVIQSGQGNRSFYNPTAILVNPVDACKMDLLKDSEGRKLYPDGVTEINGVPVIRTILVPANEAYVGDFTKGTVYTLREMEMELADQHGTDFLSDTLRLKATLRKGLLIRNVWANAFLKVADIATAATALTQP